MKLSEEVGIKLEIKVGEGKLDIMEEDEHERVEESINEEVKGNGEVNGIGDKDIISNGGEGLIEKRVVGIVDIGMGTYFSHFYCS